jgi:uncharacterized membrane-anchored protein YhcB (DUF1043 family)
MERKSNGNLSLIIGLLLGYTSYFVFEVLSDEQKRKSAEKRLKELMDSLDPYKKEFAKRVEESEELKDLLKKVEEIFGVSFDKNKPKEPEEESRPMSGRTKLVKSIKSSKNFFSIK